MRESDPFFLVEDSLDEKLSELEHIDTTDSLQHFDLGGIFKSRSKYKGGFKKGKNTKEYNHDYYIHNKDKWKKDGENTEMSLDELKELGLSEEDIKALNLDVDAKGIVVVPTKWITDFLSDSSEKIGNFIHNIANQIDTIFNPGNHVYINPDLITLNPDSDDEPKDTKEPEMGPKSPWYTDPKTIDDPQKFPVYSYEFEDQSGRNSETLDLDFDYADYYEGFAIKDQPMSVVEDCAAVNPNYDSNSDDGYSRNCAWCSYVYDLRRRGYDVEAPYMMGMMNSEIATFYKDTTWKDYKQVGDKNLSSKENTQVLFSQLESEGNGARGILNVGWLSGGEHAMAWEIIDGKAYVIDAQTNNVMDVDEFYDRRGYAIDWNYYENTCRDYPDCDLSDEEVRANMNGCQYLRTDNRELNITGEIKRRDLTYELSGGKLVYSMQDTGETVNLAETIVSHKPNDKSKEAWKKISDAKKHSKLKRKSTKRRKKTTDEYRRS